MEVSILRRVLVSLLLAAGLALGASSSPAASSFRVIAHHDVKGVRISRSVLSSIFLRQAPKWGDGSAVLPVDQSVRSNVRRAFTGDVLLQGVQEIQLYWQRQMSTGVTPPPVKSSDQEVVAYVASTPGAIGYVTIEAPLPEGVKTIELAD
jgi:ABC-type phosphate transport system substrate-binding protein